MMLRLSHLARATSCAVRVTLGALLWLGCAIAALLLGVIMLIPDFWMAFVITPLSAACGELCCPLLRKAMPNTKRARLRGEARMQAAPPLQQQRGCLCSIVRVSSTSILASGSDATYTADVRYAKSACNCVRYMCCSTGRDDVRAGTPWCLCCASQRDMQWAALADVPPLVSDADVKAAAAPFVPVHARCSLQGCAQSRDVHCDTQRCAKHCTSCKFHASGGVATIASSSLSSSSAYDASIQSSAPAQEPVAIDIRQMPAPAFPQQQQQQQHPGDAPPAYEVDD
jgi:hypothetical protein